MGKALLRRRGASATISSETIAVGPLEVDIPGRRARVNGVDVDGDRFKPGWTAYQWRVIHESTDVTALLAPGRNVLGARLAGQPRVGLAAVLEHYLHMTLAKEHSAVDWSTRPLPEPWLRYAALDVEQFHLDHVEGVTGINQNLPLIGATAIDILASQLYHNEQGLPQRPVFSMIEGFWVDGQTAPPRRPAG